MATKIKIQHYVPRFYLNGFTIQQTKVLVYCFDKLESKYFKVNTRNVASESYFYDIPDEVEQRIEKAFSQIESFFVPVYNKIVSTEDPALLSSEEKFTLAFFLVSQESRTREHRETQTDMMKQLKKRIAKEELTDELKERLGVD